MSLGVKSDTMRYTVRFVAHPGVNVTLRLRLPELLEERGWTAYRLSKESGDRISLPTAHRLVRQRGRIKQFRAEVLEALCDTLGIGVAEVVVPAALGWVIRIEHRLKEPASGHYVSGGSCFEGGVTGSSCALTLIRSCSALTASTALTP